MTISPPAVLNLHLLMEIHAKAAFRIVNNVARLLIAFSVTLDM